METVGGVRIYLAPKQYDDISSLFFFFFFFFVCFFVFGRKEGEEVSKWTGFFSSVD